MDIATSTREVEISEVRLRFPERADYVIGPETAVQAIQKALDKIQGFREKDLHFIRDIVGPLVPNEFRSLMHTLQLTRASLSYRSIVRTAGYLTALATRLGLEKRLDMVKHYYRLAVLPFIDLMLREKIEKLGKEKPLGWRLQKFVYARLLHSIECTVDNLIGLIALGWTFCPGIGEPEMETGFYNRFVFGRRCGFLDLGHFFNCAIVAYLYGFEEAKKRGESTEIQQNRLRRKSWLVFLRKHKFLPLITDLLWGYATSADTIEDRASDWFGILLGQKMREYANNGKIIDFFMEQWPKLVKGEVLGPEEMSIFRKIYEAIKLIAASVRQRLGTGGRFDLTNYMKEFFIKHDAIDPKELPPELLEEIIRFYTEKYNSAEWDKYTAKEWEVVIPQELWEQVVRHKWTEAETELPVKIQMKDKGQKVAPYFG
ncbi:MAG: hypothetical protein ONB44_20365 [candidate division KSB1 bacterium]|nr:hypothetical protein [candidate division KSB1 bacterium]MDZ7304485.1 hypothetical protein [candidate division KSB1 bacterium]MDZ7312992.1 hypothetical protein [candidate division KSB1 bacterium]